MTKSRLEAFSDGVLAIIITIMVLEIDVPTEGTFLALKHNALIFVSYILSFLYVGIYRGNHHHLVHTVNKITSKILLANLHLLFWLSLIPFATAWLGESRFARDPLILYAVILLCCAIAYYIFQAAINPTNTQNKDLLIALKKQEKKGFVSIIAYIIAILTAPFTPYIPSLMFVVVAIAWLVPDKGIENALDIEEFPIEKNT